MRYLNFCLLLILATIITACGGNTYYLTTDDARGIEAGDPVYRQGIAVGEVEDVRFEGRHVNIEISTREALYEDQGFSIRHGAEGLQLELDRPVAGANQLADGATISEDPFGEHLLEGLEGLGEGIGLALERTLGRDGEKLEYTLEKLANRFEAGAEGWGKRIERWAEEHEEEIEEWAEALEENSEEIAESAEAWAEEHEEEFKELGRKLDRWSKENEVEFKEFSDEIDAWSEDFDGNMEDFVQALERVSNRHKVGSKAWKSEMKKALKDLE
ncbi:MlaD family protein [Neolewinella persica]|uniref:MlaD family protein n=1 Tax=Neolewinella persica TaxID=70998 RepID=UPI0003746EDB|nr:MCE family protein [Neolewinella persica]